MKSIPLDAFRKYLVEGFKKCGLNDENAERAADVHYRVTLRGTGHHDVSAFPGRAGAVLDGTFAANPEFVKLASFGAMESWDGGNGLGEVVCSFIIDRAMALADEHGLGFCAVRNSNHFLAASPYIERATERGYIALMFAKGGADMGGPDGNADHCMSALPLGMAYPTDEYAVMLDVCMAYISYGQLARKIAAGEKVEPWWGVDKDGNPTTDPSALAAGTRFPIGGHKGFGLSMLGEVLTSVMGMGTILDQKETPDGLKNPTTHSALVIKAGAFFGNDKFLSRAGELTRRTDARSPGIRIPGKRSHEYREECLKNGAIELDDKLVGQLNDMAERLGIVKL